MIDKLDELDVRRMHVLSTQSARCARKAACNRSTYRATRMTIRVAHATTADDALS